MHSSDGGNENTDFQSHPDSVDVILQDFSIAIVNRPDSSKNKDILHPINTVIEGGTLFAILGGSGSGKTTLLNVIAGRYSPNQLEVGGEIRFGSVQRCSIGYVTQQDFLLPNLTVRETLIFAARMKVDPASHPTTVGRKNEHTQGSRTADAIYNQLVDDVIQDLGLKECANSMVGDNNGTSQLTGGNRGLSGGERRRVSIAIQIISDCKVLCADEPTSGLDSFTAITVVEALFRLSRGTHHTTVISSIHQPRADVFHMFDAVLLLSKGGQAIYCGTTKAMVNYFKRLGFDCPKNSNPADYFVDLSSIDTRSTDEVHASRARVDKLVDSFNEFQMRMTLSVASMRSEDLIPSPKMKEKRSRKEAFFATVEPMEYRASWNAQVYYLVGRFFRNNFRDLFGALGSLMQAIVLGLIVMAIFFQLTDDLADIESRNGLLYITVSMEYYILMIILIERYCCELKVFDRELQDQLYAPSAYLTAHIISAAPLLILQPLAYAVPIYFGSNLRHGFTHALMFMAVNVSQSFIINGLVWMCLSVSRDFTIASLIANMNFTFISLTAGFLVNYHDIPVYVKWVRYLSFCSYSYRILMSNEYSNRVIPGCSSPNPADCTQYDGNTILDSQDIAVNDYSSTWPSLLALCVVYHTVAFVLLHYVRHPVTGIVGSDIAVDDTVVEENPVTTLAGVSEAGSGKNAPIEALLANEEFRSQVAITISGVSLLVHTNRLHNKDTIGGSAGVSGKSNATASPLPNTGDTSPFFGGSSENLYIADGTAATVSKTKMILSDVNASIKPGRLVALMGGSGSGKTTLLNLIAGRISPKCLQGSAGESYGQNKQSCLGKMLSDGSAYEGCGQILFNNTVPSGAKLRELIGYVQQFDFHLPSLTVKETLMFHANLRLPLGMDQLKRQQRVQQVLSTLDLHHCAHTRVGDAELKGISGGEKRRLSLGVQLLADPAVCLLDEPTTGLDAFTARHVVQTLQTLAHRGRTVVVSIHQPRYDVFALLDDVILLSRGHLIWAGSSAEMLKHFAALGHPCPFLTNPADFILDISSIDFRSEEKEEGSRTRLQALLRGQKAYQTKGLTIHTYSDGFDFDNDSDGDSASLSPSVLSSPARSSRGPSRVVSKVGSGDYSPKHSDELHNITIETSVDELNFMVPGGGRKRTATTESNFAMSTVASKPLYYTLPLLLHRSFLNMSRQPAICWNRISQGTFYGLILACFYAPMGDDQNSIQDRIGNLYELTALAFIGMLSCIAIFPCERNVFYREYVDGDYSALAFFLSYFIIAIPFVAVTAVIIAALMTYAVGLQPTTEALVTFSCVIFCFIAMGECVGVIFCSLFMHVGFSVNVMSVVLSLFGIMAGYISLDMPIFLRYISYVSPVTWGSYIVANSAFQGETFTCDVSEEDSQGNCPTSTGEQVLDLYDMGGGSGKYGVQYHTMMLAIVMVAIFAVTYLVLRARAYNISH